MFRVLAAALLSVLTITASAGLASAATQGAASTGTVPSVTAPVAHDKAIDKAKPAATKKKDKTVSAATVSHPAGKTLETGKPMTKPAS